MQGFSGVFDDILARLTALSKRITAFETHEYNKIKALHATSRTLDNVAITDGTTYTSGDVRGTNGVHINAAGIYGVFYITPLTVNVDIYFGMGGDTLDQFSQTYRWLGAVGEEHQLMSQFVMIPLSAGGTFSIKPVGSNIAAYLTITGYWM